MSFRDQRPKRVIDLRTEDRSRVERPPQNRKPRPWSHQVDLAHSKGKKILLGTPDGPLTGVLLEADQFTLKVQDDQTHSAVVVFKSALTYFKVV